MDHFEALNQKLNNLKNSNAIIGEVTFVFVNDFRETFLVIANEVRANIIKSCLKSSILQGLIQTLIFCTNMIAYLSENNDKYF